MRRESEYFENRELDLLFMARRLREALRLEELLTQSGVEYYVETGDYEGGLLFKRQLTGAYFYVMPEDLDTARKVLLESRLKPYNPQRNQ